MFLNVKGEVRLRIIYCKFGFDRVGRIEVIGDDILVFFFIGEFYVA